MSAPRWLAQAAWGGAILTLVVLAATVLMRLGTRIDAAGTAVSMLPADLEFWARVAHRVAAGVVGVIAAAALVAVARGGAALGAHRAQVAWIVGLTVVLAVVGRYTPGYRHDIVTVVNVAGGVALAIAFASLASSAAGRGDPCAVGALAVLLALVASGAAADAAAMHGMRAYGPLHLGLGLLFAALALAAAWRGRHRPALAASVALLTLAQSGLGLYLIRVTLQRPIPPVWVHSLAAVVLALLLVRLAVGLRDSRDAAPVPGARLA